MNGGSEGNANVDSRMVGRANTDSWGGSNEAAAGKLKAR
jgi:hypothetical protein